MLFLMLIIALKRSGAQDTNTSSLSYTVTIPAVALLSLGGPTSISLSPTAPTEAGLGLNFSGSTNNQVWVNVSSTVGTTIKTTRNVSAQITSGSVPSGFILRVQPTAATSGAGTRGTVSGVITLSGSAQNIVTAIGSCYTNNGVNNGYRLTYTLVKNTYSAIKFDQPANLTITYTLSD